jgi:hypothetical protein
VVQEKTAIDLSKKEMEMRHSWNEYFPPKYLDGSLERNLIPVSDFAIFYHQMGQLPFPAVKEFQPLILRFLCLPTWSRACMVRLDSQGLTFRLRSCELSGEAGFDLGRVIQEQDRLLTFEETEMVYASMDQIRFWSLTSYDPEEPDVFDGTDYLLEGARHGKYLVAYRNEIEALDDFDYPDGLTPFGEFCQLLLNLAKLEMR